MLNEKIFYFFYNLSGQSPFFDEVIVFFAVYLPFLVAVGAFIYLFIYKKSFWNTFYVFFSAGASWLASKVLKILINTPRPFDSLPDVSALFPQTSNAFPSGHAAFFGALACAVFFLNKKAGYIFILCAVLIGLARIMAGVHFPVDILGGFTLGILAAFMIKKISVKVGNIF
jgi:undecaprenyl-diphosphatase